MISFRFFIMASSEGCLTCLRACSKTYSHTSYTPELEPESPVLKCSHASSPLSHGPVRHEWQSHHAGTTTSICGSRPRSVMRVIGDQKKRPTQVGVIGPFDVAGVIGLCDGVLLRLMRSVTSTSSPTRRTAPDGPAQAYWPKTGLSVYVVRFCGR
jgi:hypothetical protein